MLTKMYLFISTCMLLNLMYVSCNPDTKRLYDDLLSNYNRLIRPVGNNSDRLTVKMGLKLSQLIDVNLRSQIMTTNVWVEQEWTDYKLKWNPDDYGGVETLHVPSENIWLPDIVLYNNADGNYEITIMTKANLHYTGKVIWKPPAIYKSFCEIDVEYFPFDEQTCFMKFGSWTYDGYLIDLRHLYQSMDSDVIENGIDLQDYYISVEWDIMKVPAIRNEKFYSCCEESYPDIKFNITLRRKTLFYLVNLIIPCVGISCLSVLVFYLPSDSGEKISLCISVLLSLTVFVLLLIEIIPPTSLTLPLLGRYLLFTMAMVTFSVVVTIAVLNINFRSPVTHKLSPWIRKWFIEILPKYLWMERPNNQNDQHNEDKDANDILKNVYQQPLMNHYNNQKYFTGSFDLRLSPPYRFEVSPLNCYDDKNCLKIPFPSSEINEETDTYNYHIDKKEIKYDTNIAIYKINDSEKVLEDTKFIAQHMKNKDAFENIVDDWKYVALVVDRLFLWIFTLTCIIGTALIILRAPCLYDTKKPIDVAFSKVAKKKMELLKMGSEDI